MVQWTAIKQYYITGTVFILAIGNLFYYRYQQVSGPSILREEDLKKYEKFKKEKLEADEALRQQNKEKLGGKKILAK